MPLKTKRSKTCQKLIAHKSVRPLIRRHSKVCFELKHNQEVCSSGFYHILFLHIYYFIIENSEGSRIKNQQIISYHEM